MAKKKEQLEEVVEETPEVVEEAVEEVSEEVTAEPEVEPESEEEDEVIEKVDDLEVETEQLAKEILETREELSVIKEVRNELVKLYGDYQEVEKLKNDFADENEKLKEQLSVVSAKLQEYQIAEEKLAEERRVQRLEKLSAKFAALGQSKTVEQLRAKDEETLKEFETIVDTALSRVGETAEMPSVTKNSQSEMLSNTSNTEKVSDQVAKEVSKPVRTEKLSDKEFFANICNQLTGEQAIVGNGKKVKNF